MTLDHTHFTCFDDVETWYNKIKPLGGTKHKGDDVRPIGDRARKYERIVKIDNDCYALSEGWHHGDALFPTYSGKGSTATLADMERYAPIVWRRFGQGVETTTIRNGAGPYCHTRRYMFLKRHMPRGLSFVQTQVGKQFVRMWGTGVELFLAKEQAGAADTAALTFRRVSTGGWEFISNNGAYPAIPRVVVDKETKAQHKDAIKAFCDWALTMYPMLNLRDHLVRHEYNTQFNTWIRDSGAKHHRSWGRIANRAAADTLRLIVADPDHPMRVPLMVAMIVESDLETHDIQDQEALTLARGKMNRWINNALGFVKKG